MPKTNWDLAMTPEQVDQMFRDMDRAHDLFLREYLCPIRPPYKDRVCYACKRPIRISFYLKNGGTGKQWNDDRIQILCCSCLDQHTPPIHATAVFDDGHHLQSIEVRFSDIQ